MSTYLDYTIESVANDKSIFLAKSNFLSDDVASSSILKHAFADFFEDRPSFAERVNQLSLSEETKSTFAVKIPKESSSYSWELFSSTSVRADSPNYPYKYSPKFEFQKINVQTDLKADICSYIEKQLQTSVVKTYRETLIGVNIKEFQKALKHLKTYLIIDKNDSLEITDQEVFENLIKDNQIENLKYINNSYYLLFANTYEALHYIKDYKMFKNVDVLKVLTKEVGQIVYTDSESHEVPQYSIPTNVYSFNKSAIEQLLSFLEKRLATINKSFTVENLVKAKIKTFLEDSLEDKDTKLYKKLQAFVEDSEEIYYEEFLEETEYQVEETKKLLIFMQQHANPRVIWRIS